MTQQDLERIAAYEARTRPTPTTRLLRRLGRTRAFATVYRTTLAHVDAALYHRTSGGLTRLYGLPALVLTTTGAKTGERRESPLIYTRDGEDFVVAGSNWGQSRHPGWTANLLKNPSATVQVGPVSVPVQGRLVDDGDEWSRLWAKFVAIYPGYEGYLQRAGGRQPRIFVLTPTAK